MASPKELKEQRRREREETERRPSRLSGAGAGRERRIRLQPGPGASRAKGRCDADGHRDASRDPGVQRVPGAARQRAMRERGHPVRPGECRPHSGVDSPARARRRPRRHRRPRRLRANRAATSVPAALARSPRQGRARLRPSGTAAQREARARATFWRRLAVYRRRTPARAVSGLTAPVVPRRRPLRGAARRAR